MNPRGRLNLVMGLLAAAALAFGVARWRQQLNTAASSEQLAHRLAQARAENRKHDDPKASREGRASSAQQDSPALPPWGQPLGPSLDALRQRADAGDARAACRIGLELNLCAMSKQAQSLASPPTANVSTNAPTASLSTTQPAAPSVPPRNYCEGINAALLNQASTYLRNAALAGNRDAMLLYAQGSFIKAADTSDQYRHLQDPAFASWYREALPTLQRALNAGDPRAAQLLANAYSDDDGPLDALVTDSPAQAYTYRLLLSYLRAQSPPSPDGLDVRQRADADQKAQRLYREAFASHAAAGGVPQEIEFRPSAGGPAPCQ